jgi:hypothetical protein
VFPEPGYYRVTATAATRSNERQRTDDGRPVQDITQRELWLWVSESSGQVTSTFRRDLFPDTVLPAPGPFRTLPGLRALRALTRTINAAARSPRALRPAPLLGAPRGATIRPSTTTGRVRGQRQPSGGVVMANDVPAGQRRITVQYVSQDDPSHPNAMAPLAGAQFVTRAYHPGVCDGYYEQCQVPAYWEDVDWGVTDANGSLTEVCAASDPDVVSLLVTVYQNAPNVATVNGGPDVVNYGWASDPSCPGATDISQTVNDSPAAGAFTHILRAVAGSRAQFQPFSRGPLDVRLDGGTNISYYSSSDDRITIANSGQNAAVWGSYGWFTAAHEYGHALHEKALGGIFKSEYCPSGGHAFGLSTNGGCAFYEGFADYHAAVALGVSSGLGGFYSSEVAYHALFRDPSSGNPSQDELPVAAFLYDLSGQLGPQFVASTIRDCRLVYFYYVGGYGRQLFQQPVGNSSALTWCFERGVDGNARNQYFGSNVYLPIQFQSSTTPPSTWSQPLVRQAWLRDIFLQ